MALLPVPFGVVDYRPRVATSHRLGNIERARIKHLRFSENPRQS